MWEWFLKAPSAVSHAAAAPIDQQQIQGQDSLSPSSTSLAPLLSADLLAILSSAPLISPPLTAVWGTKSCTLTSTVFFTLYFHGRREAQRERQRKLWWDLIQCQWKHVGFQRLEGLSRPARCDRLVHHSHTDRNPAPQPVSRASLRYFSLPFTEREPFKVQICPLVGLLRHVCQLQDIFSYSTLSWDVWCWRVFILASVKCGRKKLHSL